jgi:hypothetical protein
MKLYAMLFSAKNCCLYNKHYHMASKNIPIPHGGPLQGKFSFGSFPPLLWVRMGIVSALTSLRDLWMGLLSWRWVPGARCDACGEPSVFVSTKKHQYIGDAKVTNWTKSR